MAIKVTPITKEVLGMESDNHLILQTFPAITTIDVATYRRAATDNAPRFSVAPRNVGRLGVFAAENDGDERSVILVLPKQGVPDQLLIGVSHGFGQSAKHYAGKGWSNPRSPALIEFVLLKHVVKRWGAQMLAANKNMALMHIVRAAGRSELGPFAKDGPFVAQAIEEISKATDRAFEAKRVDTFTFSSGIYDYLPFINGMSGHLPLRRIYNIDPPAQVSAPRPEGATLHQFSRSRRGHPSFEFLPLARWKNEPDGRHYIKTHGIFNYLHNWCMPRYVLHLGLIT